MDSRVVNVFPVKYLRSSPPDPYPDVKLPGLAPDIDSDGEEEWEVVDLRAHRVRNRVSEFLVVYKGYEDDIGDTEWRPESELEITCKELLDKKKETLLKETESREKTSSVTKRTRTSEKQPLRRSRRRRQRGMSKM